MHTRSWCELAEAETVERACRYLLTWDDATLLVTERLLQRPDGWAFLNDVQHRFPRTKRCLLATYGSLSAVIEAIHAGAVQSLVHVPLRRDQFLAAVAHEPELAIA